VTRLDGLFDALDRLIGWATAALLAVAYALSVYGVFERYALSGSGTDWLGEVVVFTMVWAILLSVARIEHRRAHLRMDIVWRRFSEPAKVRAEYVSLFLGLAVSAVLVWSGWLVLKDNMIWDERTDSSLRLPFWVYYAALSTAFSVHLLFVLHRLTLLARGKVILDHGDLTSVIRTTGDLSD
jgi:TRAP-type C4-dicarboxylate transport system permease small subunit